jgi:RNase adapter protein RapZ
MTDSSLSSPLLIIVTGLSGSGHSTALKALEDRGVYCMDNLPLELLPSTVRHLRHSTDYPESTYAFGMDVRSKSFALGFLNMKNELAQGERLDCLFLTADTSVIATRFGATRRRHPLITTGKTLEDAIDRERVLLSPIEDSADVVLDTSQWSPHQLARAVEARYASALPERNMTVTITSFGFKFGQHRMVDSIFDVRFLKNPNYVPELKVKDGRDLDVSQYVFSDPSAEEMFRRIEDLNRYVLPRYVREGKHYFRLGIGCSGGQHRSVAFAERLAASLKANPIPNILVQVSHRDLDQYRD